MARLKNKNSGAIVNIPDEKAERLGPEWESDAKKAPAKKAAPSKSDEK